jgi:valyl-tRNA synthetase
LDQIAKVEQGLANTERKLNDETFIQKAPTEIIERERKNLIDYQEKKIKLQENLQLLEEVK